MSGSLVSAGSGVGPSGDPAPTAPPDLSLIRLRSFNAVGNSNFEVDQRNVGSQLANPGSAVFALDRWRVMKTGTMGISTQQMATGNLCVVPGTNFRISGTMLNIALTTQEMSLAAGDNWRIQHQIEGSMAREIANDVSSISLLVGSSVVPLKFGLALRDSAGAYSLCKLCTISATGWNLIPLPNIPVFASGGTFPITPGNLSYFLEITLCAGSTYTAPANDIWQSGNFLGAVGQDNFASQPVNSVFQVAFVQHEPGPLCTTLIDKPFTQNLDECLRYYDKSYNYAVALGTVSSSSCYFITPGTANPLFYVPFKKRMAKTPTVVGYSPTTGAVNNVRDLNGNVDRAISSTGSPTESGFSGFQLATQNSGLANYTWHYTADTGW